jgi:DNA-directed RNA polymerase II subunit RPB2
MVKSCLCPLSQKTKEFCVSVGECPYDQGGYYIISGKEKAIVADERIATNKLFVNFVNDNSSMF